MRARARVWMTGVAACCLVVGAGRPEAGNPQGIVGLLPVYNASGEPYGDVFSGFLTTSVFDVLREEGWSLVLLNPGGLYSPLDEGPAFDHARKTGVHWVVMLRLKPAYRDESSDGKPEIEVEGRIVSVPPGLAERSLVVRHEVKRRDLDGGFDIGPYPRIPRGAAASEVSLWYWYQVQSSRRLSKQPLGKAVLKTAANLRAVLAERLRGLGVSPSVNRATAGACDVELRVKDENGKWSSKNYTVIANGRDESAGVRTGVLNLHVQSGMLLLQITPKDTPFGLPIQPVYLANVSIDCSARPEVLTLAIGPSGEAMLVSR